MTTRILFTLPCLIGGGAERVTLHILNHLDRTVFEPVLVLGRDRGELRDQVPNDVEVFEVGHERIRHVAPGLIRQVRRLQPEVIYGTLGYGWLLASARTFLPKDTFIVSRLANTLSAFYEDLARTNESGALVLRAAHRVGYERSDVSVCQSLEMQQDACRELEVDGRGFITIHNPVDLAALRSRTAEGSVDRSLVVSVGNLHWRKGYDLLVEAWPEFASLGMTLMIIGEGTERARLEKRIKELKLEKSVLLPGYIQDPHEWVVQARFFVSSSRYEGFSNVILESLALGTPVLATDCPGSNREVMTPGVHGELVETSVNGLRNGIRLALDSAETWRAQRSSWAINERFGIPEIMDRWQNVFLGGR